MNRIAAVVTGLSLAFAGTSATIAATINVPGDQPTIAAAINTAVTGDVITIAAGTYNEHSLSPGGKAITIQGTLNANGSLATTIDGQQGGSVFVFNSGETSATVIQDLVITKGNGTPLFGSIIGGGILCISNSNPTITDCTISGNTANYGGGIFCKDSNPTITDCTIEGNTANTGGGGIFCDKSNPAISGGTISGNTANNSGGGIYCFQSSPTISGCTITNNTSAYGGGGIICFNGASESNPTISGCTFTNNVPDTIIGDFNTGEASPSTGACCLNGTCITATESDCTAAGGTYGSDDMACADANCATTTPGDVDGDGEVDVNDLDSLHASLGICQHDVDLDGDTDVEDLLLFLAGYGTTCP